MRICENKDADQLRSSSSFAVLTGIIFPTLDEADVEVGKVALL